ncbi:unnamed protein product [Mycena citricolor]|uniref:Late embryogenesis abundant protein LEA-2 subgroup domain-containing protein n=1 Tax=Mycena citricolor TaxID=2018698 RepID=A0AAD2K448_9AGAR|nr:unnamed protein product [Mycena citricolor]
MAYQDPYAGQHGRYEEPQYGHSGYGQYDASATQFNPYTTSEPHPTYEQGGYDNYVGGYRDEPEFGHGAANAPPAPRPPKSLDETSRFEPGEFSPTTRDPKSDLHKGGQGRCIGRFFCCTLMSLVFLIVIALLALVLWLRPPSLTFGSVAPVTSGSTIALTSNGVNINMGVNISVTNPNYLGVSFKKISAQIFYPINNTAIGNGTLNNINIQSKSTTNFTFPFEIQYSTAIDPNSKILLDLATKCGVLPGATSQLTVDYKITLALRILFVTVSPTISNSFTFACPLTADELKVLMFLPEHFNQILK